MADPELNRFRTMLAHPDHTTAVEAFLDMLDRPDVMVGLIYAASFGVPGIVPPCMPLKGHPTFGTVVSGNDQLKQGLGVLVKLRCRSLGLTPIRDQGKATVAKWIPWFTLAQVYKPTSEVRAAAALAPEICNGQSLLELSPRG